MKKEERSLLFGDRGPRIAGFTLAGLTDIHKREPGVFYKQTMDEILAVLVESVLAWRMEHAPVKGKGKQYSEWILDQIDAIRQHLRDGGDPNSCFLGFNLASLVAEANQKHDMTNRRIGRGRTKGATNANKKRITKSDEFNKKYTPKYQRRVDHYVLVGEMGHKKACQEAAKYFRSKNKGDRRHNWRRVYDLTRDPRNRSHTL